MAIPVGKTLYKSLQWRFCQFFSAFVVNVLFARLLSSAIAAEFYSLVYVLSLCISLFTLGLDIGLNYYLSRREITVKAVRPLILGILLVALIICLPSVYWYYHSSSHLAFPRLLLLFAGCHIAGGLLTVLSGAVFTAFGKNHIAARIAFFANLVTIVLALLYNYCSKGEARVNGIFLSYFLLSLGQGLWLLLLSYRKDHAEAPAQSDNRQLLVALFRFSFFAFLANFIFFLGMRCTIYLIPYYLPAAVQGNYIQAYKIVEYLGQIVAFLYYPLMALVAGAGAEKMKRPVLLLIRISNTLVLLFSIFILLTGRWLFPFIFGSSFTGMYIIFLGFIPGLFAVCSSSFLTSWYYGSGHLRYNFFSACIQLVAMPLFFWLFIGQGGALGAAFAFSAASILSLCYDLIIFRKLHVFRIREAGLVTAEDVRMTWQTFKKIILS